MPTNSNRHLRGTTPAPLMPFLSFYTDDKHKQVHHDALNHILKIFKEAGMKHYNISHIDDPERIPGLPIKIGKHLYDLSFPLSNNTFLLIEVKILKLPKTSKEVVKHGNR